MSKDDEIQTNRFRFPEESYATERTLIQEEFDELSMYEQSRRKRFQNFLLSGIFLLLLLGVGVGVYYLWKTGTISFSKKQEKKSPEQLYVADRLLPETSYYIPDTNLNTLLRKAVSHYRAGENRQAIVDFESIINGTHPKSQKAIALIYMGVIALERKRYVLARNQFLRALSYDPQAIGAVVNLAILEHRVKNQTAAREYAFRARKMSPEDPRVLLLLGNILLANDETDKAIDSYERAVSGIPEDILSYYNLGLAHLRKGNLESSLQNFKRVIAHAERSSSYPNDGLLGGAKGQPSSYLESRSLRARSYAQIGQIYFEKGRMDEAADYLRKAIRFAPEKSKYLYNLGIVYLHRQEPEQALMYFQKALGASEKSPQVYRSLALAFEKINREDLAIDSLQKVLLINPGDIEALFRLGDIHHQNGDLLEAVDSFRKITNLTQGNLQTEEALIKLASVYLDMERRNSALDVLERAVQLRPESTMAHLMLGRVYEKSGRRDLAVASWKKALTLAPYGNLRKKILERKEEREIRIALARAYRKEGAFGLALQQYQFIRKRNQEAPTQQEDPQLDWELAQTYQESGDHSNTSILFRKIVKSPHANLELRKGALMGLAHLYLNSDREDPESIAQALAYANQAKRLLPDDFEVKLLEAEVLLKTKLGSNREKSLEILKTIIYSKVEASLLSKAYNLMGLAYKENSEWERALKSFNYALQINPRNQEALQNQREASHSYEKSL